MPASVPEPLQELILRMLEKDPADRPSARDAAHSARAPGGKSAETCAFGPGRDQAEAERANLSGSVIKRSGGVSGGQCVYLKGETT